MGEFPTSTATDTELIALGEQLEGLLREYMDAWLEWAPRMRAAHAEAKDNTSALAVAIRHTGCDVAQERMSELEHDMQPLAEEIIAAPVTSLGGLFRSPDPSCNGYLAFTAMLMAGLDGIQNRIDPGKPIDKNLYDLPPAEAKEVKSTPGSLEQALDALEADHAFLLRGDVFTEDVIETWLGYKRDKEVDAIRLRPHPYEFHLYYDI